MCVSMYAHVCVCVVFNECFLLTFLSLPAPHTYTHTHTININDTEKLCSGLCLATQSQSQARPSCPSFPKSSAARVFAVSSSLWPQRSVCDSLAVLLASTSHNKQVLMGSGTPALRFSSPAALLASAKLPSSRLPLSPLNTA